MSRHNVTLYTGPYLNDPRQRPRELVTFDLEINLEELASMMGARAANTRTGVSKMHDGLVVARVVNRSKLPPEAEGGA